MAVLPRALPARAISKTGAMGADPCNKAYTLLECLRASIFSTIHLQSLGMGTLGINMSA
jgi:hypothetical protein